MDPMNPMNCVNVGGAKVQTLGYTRKEKRGVNKAIHKNEVRVIFPFFDFPLC
jgi:hypothetical protein